MDEELLEAIRDHLVTIETYLQRNNDAMADKQEEDINLCEYTRRLRI